MNKAFNLDNFSVIKTDRGLSYEDRGLSYETRYVPGRNDEFRFSVGDDGSIFFHNHGYLSDPHFVLFCIQIARHFQNDAAADLLESFEKEIVSSATESTNTKRFWFRDKGLLCCLTVDKIGKTLGLIPAKERQR
jgi:hypothetical protein